MYCKLRPGREVWQRLLVFLIGFSKLLAVIGLFAAALSALSWAVGISYAGALVLALIGSGAALMLTAIVVVTLHEWLCEKSWFPSGDDSDDD